mgnify:CR=1 FL=1
MIEIVLKKNESFLVRSGDVLFRISDWGDAIMAGGRGYLVIEEATSGEDPRKLRVECIASEEGVVDEFLFGDAICVGLAEED